MKNILRFVLNLAAITTLLLGSVYGQELRGTLKGGAAERGLSAEIIKSREGDRCLRPHRGAPQALSGARTLQRLRACR